MKRIATELRCLLDGRHRPTEPPRHKEKRERERETDRRTKAEKEEMKEWKKERKKERKRKKRRSAVGRVLTMAGCRWVFMFEFFFYVVVIVEDDGYPSRPVFLSTSFSLWSLVLILLGFCWALLGFAVDFAHRLVERRLILQLLLGCT